LKVIRAADRHFSDFGWLKTYWLFSFAEYHDPNNIRLGNLRVFNDDIVEPGTGFPTHPHHEMEIVTIVLQGEITHQDSMGNKNVIRPGDVQRMSAGTGLTHSEYNLAKEPVHFYQIWIFPDERDLEPSYDQKTFQRVEWTNKLLPVASGQGHSGAVAFHTDSAIYRCRLEPGHRIDFAPEGHRAVFIYVTSGDLQVNADRLTDSDQARFEGDQSILLLAHAPCEFVLIDVPSAKR
jgi:quercetin 2,3-dioxygenase